MRILVVEDDHRIAATIKQGLEDERYAVDLAYDGETGLDLASSESYDCLILDLMLPKLDGLTLCQTLRKSSNHTPILMLTARDGLSDKVSSLNSGADDYLTKPFAFEELLARLRALTRRPRALLSSALTLKDLILDPQKFTVTRGVNSITLSKKEFSLLEYLLRHPGRVFSKSQLIAHVWDYDADILVNTVEVYVKNLRAKLGTPSLIHTIRGFGYKLE